VPARGVEHSHGSEDVHVRIEVRPFHRDAHVGLGGEVEARVRLERVEDRIAVGADVRLV